MSARQAWLAARRGVDEAEGVHAAMPVSMPALGQVQHWADWPDVRLVMVAMEAAG